MKQPTVSIAMRPGSKDELPEESQRVLRNELMVKYLESIGVTPSKANLAMLRKNIPSESIRFSTAWKSNLAGEPDYLKVYFEEPPHHVSSPSRFDHRAEMRAMAAAGPSILELSQLLDSTAVEPRGAAAGASAADEDDARGGVAPMSFDEARRAYLYPFKSERSPRKHKAREPRPQRTRHGPELGQEAEVPLAQKFLSKDALQFQPYAEEDVQSELQEDVQLHTKDIVALQARFIQVFPFERLKHRMSAEDLKATIAEISARRTARFIGMLALFLYWYHIAPKGGKHVQEEQLSKLLCAVQQYFSSVRDRMRRRRAMLMNALPILLLSVRMAVEGLMRSAFPKWWTTVDGDETLEQMDQMIEHLFDPNAYHSHITALESTSEAIRMAAREGVGLKRRSRAARYYTTSTLVSTALPKAPVVATHRQMAGDSLPAINSALAQFATPDIKHQLYQAAINSVHAEAARDAAFVSDMLLRPKTNDEKDSFHASSRGVGLSKEVSTSSSKPTTPPPTRPLTYFS
ncbi:hypothetical protein AB1Y20_019041 [Prymnesium parvum]|uniref:Uncharacterized protein n=1 Tax=Prymnesium parvum TaxID=97485 RepID=A0AB34JTI0_PRYPA